MKERASVRRVFACGAVFFLSGFMLFSGREAWAKDKSRKAESEQSSDGDKVKWTKSPTAIPTLIQLSNGRKEMIKDLNEEADTYARVKAAADKGSIDKGVSMDDIKAKYGDPTVVDTWNREGLTKLIYKKPSKDMASKEKITLIFDKDGKLTGWEEPK